MTAIPEYVTIEVQDRVHRVTDEVSIVDPDQGDRSGRDPLSRGDRSAQGQANGRQQERHRRAHGPLCPDPRGTEVRPRQTRRRWHRTGQYRSPVVDALAVEALELRPLIVGESCRDE